MCDMSLMNKLLLCEQNNTQTMLFSSLGRNTTPQHGLAVYLLCVILYMNYRAYCTLSTTHLWLLLQVNIYTLALLW